MRAAFISEEYLKDYSPIANNVDVQFIYSFVALAQDTSIQPLVGRSLYDRLQDAVTNSSLTADETELLGLLRQALLWKLVETYIPFSAIQLRNKGVVRNTGDTIAEASLEEIKYLRQEASANYDFYAKRVENYLCDNRSKFSAHLNSTDDPVKINSTYDCGIYLRSLGTCNCGPVRCSGACGCGDI